MFEKDFQATYDQNEHHDAEGDLFLPMGAEPKTANQLDLQRFQKKPIS